MPYFTVDHIKASLDYMSKHTHPTLISLLAMTRHEVPSTAGADGNPSYKVFGSTEEQKLFQDYFSPAGGPEDSPFFSVFGSGYGYSHWRDRQYAGRTLGPQRKKRDLFRQNPSNNREWAFAPDLAASIKADKVEDFVGDIPVYVIYLATWCYRDRAVASLDDAVSKFVQEFRLQEYGLIPEIFSTDVPTEYPSDALSDNPVDAGELLLILQDMEPKKEDGRTSDEKPEAERSVVLAATSPGDWRVLGTDVADMGGLKGVEEPARRAFAALAAGLHVIFTGPPGTGKTTLAEAIVEKAGFPTWTVPATDQWTTFETIGGYFPMPKDDGEDRLDFLAGAVVGAIEDGKCLIIDEINRADIDKAFGELFTLLTGNSVTLPYRRRASDGKLKRIRLQIGAALDDDKFDIIPVPDWWRMIGAMNDVDKASLKRLSMAFVRRFAFVPIDVPPPDIYEEIVRDAVARTASTREGFGDMPGLADALVELFARQDRGLAGIGLHLGPAFPKAAVRQADAEWAADPGRPLAHVMASVLELHVMPQMQGRPEIHESFLALVRPFVGGAAGSVERHLEVWSGFVGA